jgi:hypothetical protein
MLKEEKAGDRIEWGILRRNSKPTKEEAIFA